jgi:hypothetical protein
MPNRSGNWTGGAAQVLKVAIPHQMGLEMVKLRHEAHNLP